MTPDGAVVLAAMRLLAWTGDTDALAAAVMAEARSWDEVELAVGVLYREGSNRLGVVGDHGRARCAMQLHAAPAAVLTDARLCVRIGLERMRASRALCPGAPLAAYAGLPCGSERAARISRDRLRIGREALRRVGWTT